MPRVSVIVPNFNHGRFLAQRLQTILSQSFEDFELIILDDCSTDSSLSVISQYLSDPRVSMHVNASNSGSPFKQWNKGFGLAAGEYLWIAESDDYADAKLLDTLVRELDQDSSIGLAYCQSWITNADQAGTPRSRLEKWYRDFPDHERWKEGFQNDGPSELARYMVLKNTIPNASAVVFRRALLNDGLRAREDMLLAGDWMFWVELLLRSGVAYVAKPMNYFRVAHEESQRGKTAQCGLQLMEGLQVYSRIVNAVPVAADTRRAVLSYQVKIWGYYAYTRKYNFETNIEIFRQLVAHYPEAASSQYRQIILPFMYYFAAVPFRKIAVFRLSVRAINRLLKRLSGKQSTAGLVQ
jgi:glycosyltransferase involved in cell wall biosynthesis